MKGIRKVLVLALSLFMAFSLCMTISANDGDGTNGETISWTEVSNAVDSASNGQLLSALSGSGPVNVKLMNDVSVEWGDFYMITGGKVVTIDLNGHNLSSNTDIFFVIKNGKLILTNSGDSGTISSLEDTIYVVGSTDSSATDYSTVVVDEKVTVEGYNCIEINYASDVKEEYGIKVTVNGKLHAKKYNGFGGAGVHVYSGFTATSGNVPEISLGKTSEITSQAIGIDPAGYAIWTLEGKIINEEGSTCFNALPLQNGTFNIKDGYYYSNDDPNDPAEGPKAYNKNSGAAICLASAEDTTTGTEKLVVNISGGEFVSEKGYALLECISNSIGEYDENGNLVYYTEKKADATASYANLTITGGKFSGALGAVKLNDMPEDKIKVVSISGKFSSEISRYLDDDYNIFKNAEGLYEVVKKGDEANVDQSNKVTSSLDNNIYKGVKTIIRNLKVSDYISLDADEITIGFTDEDKEAVIKEIIKAESASISKDDIDYILPLYIRLGVNNYRDSDICWLDTDTDITLYLNEVTLKELSGKKVKVVRFDVNKEALLRNANSNSNNSSDVDLTVLGTTIKENGLTFSTDTFFTAYVIVAYEIPSTDTPIKSYDDKDKNQDGIIDCEEEMNSKNWVWSNTKKACVYKVSNTGTK